MRRLLLVLLTLLVPASAHAIVKYQDGMVTVRGVQLLQDREDANAYSYIPQFPRLSTRENGDLEILCLKYVGKGGAETNGGLFHALIQFALPEEWLPDLETKLQEKTGNPKARIVGAVPLLQTMKEGEANTPAGFTIVSSVLSSGQKDSFARKVIASGHAPLLPGSKAAISAVLTQEGASLLFESLQGPTSDVSVTVNGYYEAAVKAYNATVAARCSTLYEHYSKLQNIQEGYNRDQLRKITDNLITDKVLTVDVFDRSAGLGIDTKDMQGILDTVTDKLVELMFDSKEGWAKVPPRETAVEMDQIKGRQERGWFSSVFGGAQDTPYFTDNQFVLKKRTDIQVHTFRLNLSKSTTIKVPVYTSGNLGGLFDSLDVGKNKGKYFRTVNLDDPDFQKRDVSFQIDGEFAESFKDIFNQVTVSFRKVYGGGRDDVTSDLTFRKADIEKADFQNIAYARLGIQGSDWLNYEYRTSWSLRGRNRALLDPPGSDKNDRWNKSAAPGIALVPPIAKRSVEVDCDRSRLKDANLSSMTVRFVAMLGGKAEEQRSLVLRPSDASSVSKVTLYYDPDTPVAYEVTSYDASGKATRGGLQVLNESYLPLSPPMKASTEASK